MPTCVPNSLGQLHRPRRIAATSPRDDGGSAAKIVPYRRRGRGRDVVLVFQTFSPRRLVVEAVCDPARRRVDRAEGARALPQLLLILVGPHAAHTPRSSYKLTLVLLAGADELCWDETLTISEVWCRVGRRLCNDRRALQPCSEREGCGQAQTRIGQPLSSGARRKTQVLRASNHCLRCHAGRSRAAVMRWLYVSSTDRKCGLQFTSCPVE